MRTRKSDLDSPWKEALERFLPQFLAFFFPDIYDDLDWSRGYESLDKEFHQIVRDARVRRRLADKLFKVWRKDGTEAWLLIHIEVQGRCEEAFPERMFVYNYRIYDRYRRPVVSLAVLCDEDPEWRPKEFGYNYWGSKVSLRFPIAKLVDYRGQEERLERDANPFAAVVLAQLKAMETRQSPQERYTWKVRLFKGLYERGFSGEEIREWCRLIDWMLDLPEELQHAFSEEMYQFEEERRMPYVTSFERLGIKKGLEKGLKRGRKEGRREGLLEGLELNLETRFGKVDAQLLEAIRAIKEITQLRKVALALKKGKTQEELRRLAGEGAK